MPSQKDRKDPPEVFHYGTLVPVATATLSPKGTWGDMMLAWSLISTKHIDVGVGVPTTAV
jgi:hypothetical protein